jgi:hypothetical protein
MAKKNNPIDVQIDVQFDEKGMRAFDNVNSAILYFSSPEHGGHKIEKIFSLFNATFVIQIGNFWVNVSKWKSSSFDSKMATIFKGQKNKEKFDVVFAQWKSKFDVATPKKDEPIVVEPTPNVD